MNTTSSRPTKSTRGFFARWPKWLRWTVLAVVLLALAGGGYVYYQSRQTASSAGAQPALQTAVARTGSITLSASGTGTLMASAQANIGFKTGGTLTQLNVNVGDQVKAGQLLAELDDTTQQTALAQANQALLELTSPMAIATAQQTIATDEQNLINAQWDLNNLLYAHNNQSAVQSDLASLAMAQDQLSRAQKIYANTPGSPDTDPGKANAYQQLYAAQLAYNSAVAQYNYLTGKVDPVQLDAKKATVAIDQAKLTEDQTLLAALTGGQVSANATGSGYVQLQQARLALQTAQQNLANTQLIAPISGTVMSISNQVGDTVSSGTFMTIADLSQAEVQIFMDPSDWSNIKVGLEADVTFDALPSQVFTGKVTQITPQLVTVQGNQIVEGLVQLDQTQGSGPADPINLPLGESASVDVIAAKVSNVILVPIQALHQLTPTSYAVFVMVNGKPTLRLVQVGLQDPTFAEIKSGLKAGDVVTTGIQATVNNQTTTGATTP